MPATLSPAIKSTVRPAPGADRIRKAFFDASTAIERAKDKALYFGFLMIEQRASLCGGRNNFDSNKPDNEKISTWLTRTIPEIPLRTAQRWMQAAERSNAAVRLLAERGAAIDIEAVVLPMSDLLSMPEAELPESAREYRQLWLDFVSDKTIKDCLSGVLVEGDEAHRITRANNGKNAKGAGGGGDRKDFAKFTAVKLKHLSTFFKHELPPGQSAKIVASFDAALESWPKWLLEPLQDKIKAELKLSAEQRAARRQA